MKRARWFFSVMTPTRAGTCSPPDFTFYSLISCRLAFAFLRSEPQAQLLVYRKTLQQSRSLSPLLINITAFSQPHHPQPGESEFVKPIFFLAPRSPSFTLCLACKKEAYPALLKGVEVTASWPESGGRLENPARERAPSAASRWRQLG